MKRFLKEIKVAYEYIDVDLLEGDEKKKIKNEMKKWNPSGSFPTIVIDDKECVIGFEPDELKEKINL